MNYGLEYIKHIVRDLVEDMSEILETEIIVIGKDSSILIATGRLGYLLRDYTMPSGVKKVIANIIQNKRIAFVWDDNQIMFANMVREKVENFDEYLEEMEKRDIGKIKQIFIPILHKDETIGLFVVMANEKTRSLPKETLPAEVKLFRVIGQLLGSKLELLENTELKTVDEVEKEMMINSLKRYGTSSHDITKISEKLGMNRSTFYRKLKKYDIDLQTVGY